MRMEGRLSQDKLESSIASMNDLVRQRDSLTERHIFEMTAQMATRDQQVDERQRS